jgi:hypothetical protein
LTSPRSQIRAYSHSTIGTPSSLLDFELADMNQLCRHHLYGLLWCNISTSPIVPFLFGEGAPGMGNSWDLSILSSIKGIHPYLLLMFIFYYPISSSRGEPAYFLTLVTCFSRTMHPFTMVVFYGENGPGRELCWDNICLDYRMVCRSLTYILSGENIACLPFPWSADTIAPWPYPFVLLSTGRGEQNL